MNTSDQIFHRKTYAEQMAQQLLQPSPLHMNVRSGVFLSGIRRVGKTTFLRRDLVPALEALGALVIYVDLWADRSKSPAALVLEAVRNTLLQLQTPGSGLLQRFKGLNLGAAGFSFGFQLDSLGTTSGTTLAQAFAELVAKAQVNVVLIVDEVQQALGSEDGNSLLHALKAARDAVNSQPGTPGHFLFLGTGSHKSLITDMATRRAQPFTGALTTAYQVLEQDFVQWQLDAIATTPGVVLPSVAVAWAGFQLMGHRPEELLKALVQLQTGSASSSTPADQAFPIICATLASVAADVELRAIEEFGELGQAIFARIAEGSESGVSGLFGEEALAAYAERTGSQVLPPQVQNLADRMISANLIARPGHGVYTVADPFVRKVWLDRHKLLKL
ncbi:ATPase [Rhodoferax sp. TH121]|uniref:ATP-binding protein n=1 Tax=Rhodoferax sp. TH121 TaxID=2022803 RepID=UPI000B975795|nr:ATP-binding protein [Rhodoferax sp. TH121]OYQ41260.1 ATPase [Rhodoferax sp. TH121]